MVITKVAEIPMEEAIRIKEEVEEEVVVGEVMEESPIFNPHWIIKWPRVSLQQEDTVHSLDNAIIFNAMLDLMSWVGPVHH